MTKQYLDKSGLTYFYGKIKDKLPAYQAYSTSKNLRELNTGVYKVTANNLTLEYTTDWNPGGSAYSTYVTLSLAKGDVLVIQREGTPATSGSEAGNYVGDFFTIEGSVNKSYKITNAEAYSDFGDTGYIYTWQVDDLVQTKVTKTSELTNDSNFITSSALPDMSNYLAKNNTTAFTPTGDYQPATKKYVDDNAGGSTYTAGDGINITNNVISSVIPVAPYTTKSNPFGGIQEYYISFDQLKTGIYRAVRDTSKPIYLRLPINRNGSGSYTYSNIALTTDSILIVDNTAYNGSNTVGNLVANSTITVIDGRVIHTYCLSNVFVSSPTGSAVTYNNTWSENYMPDYVDNTRTLATDYWYNQLDPNSNIHIYTVSATIGTLTVEPGDMIIGNPKKSLTGQASSPKLYSYSTNSIYTFAVANSGNITITSTVDWIPSTVNALDSIPIGTGIEFFGPKNKIPTGFLIRDGSAISRTEYADLFNVIGTTYGTGDGSTTFNLPNDCGRVTVGVDENDNDFYTLGEKGGEKTHTLTTQEMPSHNHDFELSLWRNQGLNQDTNIDNTTATAWDNHYLKGSKTTDNKGGGQAHNNLQPYIAVWKLIKAKNTTPTMASIVDSYSTSTQDGYSCNYVNGLNSYSTTEQRVGTWIDGKPIYRKVINLGAITYDSGTNNINHNISNIDTITFPKFMVKMYDNWYERWEMFKDVSINSSTIIIRTSQTLTVQDSFIILEYTKTTD